MAAPLSLLALTGCVTLPEGVDEAAVLRFDDAVKSMGCVLITEPHYLGAELQTGLSRAQVIEMLQYSIALDRAVPLASGGYRFTTGECRDAA